MTRLISTTVLFGLAMTGSALAQSSNDDMPDPSPPPPVDTDTTTTTEPDTNTDTPTPMNTDVDTTIDTNIDPDATAPAGVDVNIDRDATAPADAPADIDVNIDTPDPVVTGTQDYVVPPPVEEDEGYRPFSGVGIAIAAGGGAGGFTDDRMRGAATIGGDWDVRATLGTRSLIAFEGSYIGSAQSIDALGLEGNAVLVGNGVQGALRLNGTFDLPIQPFIFAGVGWRRYGLTNVDQNLSDVSDSDDVLEVPMGVGIAGKWNGLILDARGEFRATQNEDLLPQLTAENPEGDAFESMNRWGVKATVGLEF